MSKVIFMVISKAAEECVYSVSGNKCCNFILLPSWQSQGWVRDIRFVEEGVDE